MCGRPRTQTTAPSPRAFPFLRRAIALPLGPGRTCDRARPGPPPRAARPARPPLRPGAAAAGAAGREPGRRASRGEGPSRGTEAQRRGRHRRRLGRRCRRLHPRRLFLGPKERGTCRPRSGDPSTLPPRLPPRPLPGAVGPAPLPSARRPRPDRPLARPSLPACPPTACPDPTPRAPAPRSLRTPTAALRRARTPAFTFPPAHLRAARRADPLEGAAAGDRDLGWSHVGRPWASGGCERPGPVARPRPVRRRSPYSSALLAPGLRGPGARDRPGAGVFDRGPWRADTVSEDLALRGRLSAESAISGLEPGPDFQTGAFSSGVPLPTPEEPESSLMTKPASK